MTPSIRRYAIIAAAVVVLLGAGVFVTLRLVSNGINGAIPQGDLFGPDEPDPTVSVMPTPTPSPTPPPGADIKGPLNILIVGVDTRSWIKTWRPNSDAVMIMHVNADLTKAYLTSIPRDLVVNIPAFKPAGFGGARTKLTHAMSYGSKVPGKSIPDPTQGFQLVAKTVSAYTGIKKFDAGALMTFNSFKQIVDAIGGVKLYVDQKVVSIHMRPDGKHRAVCSGCEHGFTGPRMTYNVGTRQMTGWQALDYARQRYLSGADYTRQRHQRQLIKAIIAKMADSSVVTDPVALTKLLDSVKPNGFIFDGRGRQPTEFAYALRNLRANDLTLVGLPGGGVYSDGRYIGESLRSVQSSFFAALRADKLDTFLKSHPELVNADKS